MLEARVAVTAILLYLEYRMFVWKRSKMGAGRRAPQGRSALSGG